MSRHQHESGKSGEHPDTAVEEVLHEVEEAETDVRDDGDSPGRTPATDALTPSESAQEDARRRAGDPSAPKDARRRAGDPEASRD
ncbi:hypothetical protein [Streptomyces sp. NPDC053431]|uniref:hypothetical protein n=1 Tax=Streptomyces sp. NPDC053431 TaxID=3365703 RepID=UPI0037D7D9E8